MGPATRAKLILCERYGVWPLVHTPGQVTAAQVGVLAEALREPAVRTDAGGVSKTKPKTPNKVSRERLLALARGQDAAVNDMMQP